MIRRPPRSTQSRSSAASDVYKRQTAPVQGGNVGAGTGASVGKFLWLEGGAKVGAMKGGVGSARGDVGGGIIVTALSVVSAVCNGVLRAGSVLAGNTTLPIALTTDSAVTMMPPPTST